MNAERIDAYLSSLPFTYRTLSKQGKIRYWLAKQFEGGHMFALLETVPQMSGGHMRPLFLSFGAGDAFSALLEEPHFMPAPYLARAGWVALPLDAAFPLQRVQALLEISYNLTRAKLSVDLRNRIPELSRGARQEE